MSYMYLHLASFFTFVVELYLDKSETFFVLFVIFPTFSLIVYAISIAIYEWV